MTLLHSWKGWWWHHCFCKEHTFYARNLIPFEKFVLLRSGFRWFSSPWKAVAVQIQFLSGVFGWIVVTILLDVTYRAPAASLVHAVAWLLAILPSFFVVYDVNEIFMLSPLLHKSDACFVLVFLHSNSYSELLFSGEGTRDDVGNNSFPIEHPLTIPSGIMRHSLLYRIVNPNTIKMCLL